MDFVQKLRVFVTVAERQSFAAAAEALAMTRPRVSNAVIELERDVGARLLQRTTRRTSLTNEGIQFFDQVRGALGAVDDTRNFFGGKAEPSGRLRVDMSNSIAKPVIIPRLQAFRAAYPKVDVILGVSDQQVDLIAEGVDCVLRVGEIPPSSMVSRVVYRVPLVTCASPEYLKQHGEPRKLEDLDSHEAVTYFHGRDRKLTDFQFREKGDLRMIRMKAACLVNDHEAYVACTVNGLGIGQIPALGIAKELAIGALVPVLVKFDAGERAISVMYPARKHLAPQVRAFIDWAISTFESIEVAS